VTGEEGTGLVHIAPGCGEEDNALGRELDLPALAPVDEAGRFVHGYGFLTGREAAEVGPAIAAELEARGLLVARERYRHSYPHCWRCGRELIYRLVDEWYIAMDPWRDEIKRVVEQINWIPSYGRELELDWLSNMRDWMISKKRYWGLALPIWINEDGSHFEVLGSRDELERRAVRGWREFEGHSPHRPWIDSVKILSSDGETLTRIPDVGNPWLDAGIVPYSTTRYSTDRDYFDRWVPADLVLESFPGQFRNWFYSLLAMSTMMEGIPPFRSLVGHATVRDADGEEMHKSKGNAIWFDDAVETIGADVIRWLFFSNDIRRNVNFSFETAGQIRGRFFNTVWNSHAFFVNYARIVGFDPDSPAPALGERPVLDRWILVQLRAVVEETRRAFERYEISSALRRIEEFAESLSNWYIRHSRRRFWRGHNEDSAFHTLYECLTVLCRLLAPLVPMLAEAMYRNITAVARNEPESVHLSSFPTAEELPSDDALSDRMSVAIDVTAAALHARKQAGIKVRQPLSRLQVAAATESEREAIHELADLIRSEVNVKELDQRPVGEARPVQRVAELDLRKVGPKHGKRTPKIVEAFNADPESVAKKIRGGSEVAVLQVDGQGVEIGPDDLTFRDVEPEHLSVVDVREGWTAIDVRISRELRLEGLVREVIRKVQVLRRESGLEIEDRIRLTYRTDDPDLAQALSDHRGYLQRELLATTVSQMEHGDHGAGGAAGENETVLQVDGRALEVSIAGVGRTVS
jgi:isoleucyl-tRNA synthetase